MVEQLFTGNEDVHVLLDAAKLECPAEFKDAEALFSYIQSDNPVLAETEWYDEGVAEMFIEEVKEPRLNEKLYKNYRSQQERSGVFNGIFLLMRQASISPSPVE